MEVRDCKENVFEEILRCFVGVAVGSGCRGSCADTERGLGRMYRIHGRGSAGTTA